MLTTKNFMTESGHSGNNERVPYYSWCPNNGHIPLE